MPLIFIRHGETDWNRAERFQGQQDIPLNDLGRRQAARNGRAIANILSAGGWQFIASPMLRTVETMRIVLAAAGHAAQSFTTDPALKEISYGDWEGLTPAEIRARHPAEAELREAQKWSYAPPAGESYAMLSERVSGCVRGFQAPSVVIAHGGILRCLLYQLAGLPTHDAPHLAVPQDRVILFTSRAVLTI